MHRTISPSLCEDPGTWGGLDLFLHPPEVLDSWNHCLRAWAEASTAHTDVPSVSAPSAVTDVTSGSFHASVFNTHPHPSDPRIRGTVDSVPSLRRVGRLA